MASIDTIRNEKDSENHESRKKAKRAIQQASPNSSIEQAGTKLNDDLAGSRINRKQNKPDVKGILKGLAAIIDFFFFF